MEGVGARGFGGLFGSGLGGRRRRLFDENRGQALPLADESFRAAEVLRRLRSESGTDAEDAMPVPNFLHDAAFVRLPDLQQIPLPPSGIGMTRWWACGSIDVGKSARPGVDTSVDAARKVRAPRPRSGNLGKPVYFRMKAILRSVRWPVENRPQAESPPHNERSLPPEQQIPLPPSGIGMTH